MSINKIIRRGHANQIDVQLVEKYLTLTYIPSLIIMNRFTLKFYTNLNSIQIYLLCMRCSLETFRQST